MRSGDPAGRKNNKIGIKPALPDQPAHFGQVVALPALEEHLVVFEGLDAQLGHDAGEVAAVDFAGLEVVADAVGGAADEHGRGLTWQGGGGRAARRALGHPRAWPSPRLHQPPC